MPKLLHPIDYSQTLALDHTVVTFSLSENSINVSYNMAILLQNSSDSQCTCIRDYVKWCRGCLKFWIKDWGCVSSFFSTSNTA